MMRLASAIGVTLMAFGCAWSQAQTWNWFEAPASTQIECRASDRPWSLSEAVHASQVETGKRVLMAMNGGMFHATGDPVGLHVHQGIVQTPINLDSLDQGNFFLLPNGVFGVDQSGVFHILESHAAKEIVWLEATQSGPMLLINGESHPAFRPESSNRRVRNGVGLREDGTVVFGISVDPVTFHEASMAFKAHGCVQALYLDGVVSKMYRSSDPASDSEGSFGVVVMAIEQ